MAGECARTKPGLTNTERSQRLHVDRETRDGKQEKITMAKFYRIAANKDELCDIAADYWLQCYTACVDNAKDFHVSLSGGSTPKSLYQLLATPRYSDRIDWHKVHLYFGDERCVPHDHADSNYLMAKSALLDHIDIPPENVHPVPYVEQDPAQSAGLYQQQLAAAMTTDSNGFPRFDLVLLGMGDDGHTASLFPGTPILQERERWAAEVFVSRLNSWRVSLTYPVINNAHRVMLLVAGEGKAARISEILSSASRERDEPRYPVQGVDPAGDVFWLLDQPAAAQLNTANMPDEMTQVA